MTANEVLELPPTDELLSEARVRVYHGREKGIQCPCCGQYAHIHCRRFNHQMAKYIVAFYRLAKQEGLKNWLRPTAYIEPGATPGFIDQSAGGDFAKLRHWDLLETEEIGHGLGKRFIFRFTTKGLSFVRNRSKIPKMVFIYAGEMLGTGGEMVRIDQCFQNPFHYGEMMKNGRIR